MKIWVTYNSVFGLQCGGLERVWVHFSKPQYVERWRPPREDETPFGTLSDMNGRLDAGWQPVSGYGLHALSFGKLFGYGDRESSEDDLVDFVWSHLCAHFQDKDLRDWDKVPVTPRSFILELDLNISIRNKQD